MSNSQSSNTDDDYMPMCFSDRLDLDCFMDGFERRNMGEKYFYQAVGEVAESVIPFIEDHKMYGEAQILERLTEPDRIIIFRITWEDDQGNIRANRGWRVQFNNALGPYKGGLRFHPDVNLDTFKFLGFEQCFKNALTGLPIGGAKGGSNFNPKGKSQREIMRFCQSFMLELHRHIGPDTDVPAGDIGVGAQEISYLFGYYKRLENQFHGVLTGKNIGFGGSLVRKEATGYGNIFFARDMLRKREDGLNGKTAIISGSGNVAIYTAEKALSLGVKVLALSDSQGTIYDKNGLTQEKLDIIKDIKEIRSGRISEYVEQVKEAEYLEGKTPWHIQCDLAFPCATQNELDVDDAKTLIDNGVCLVSEGANMPCMHEAIEAFHHAGVLFGPAKAANAGGVAVSALEQTQNAMRLTWSSEEVEKRLDEIMQKIHDQSADYGREYGNTPKGLINYKTGANIGGFQKLADAMLAYGVV